MQSNRRDTKSCQSSAFNLDTSDNSSYTIPRHISSHSRRGSIPILSDDRSELQANSQAQAFLCASPESHKLTCCKETCRLGSLEGRLRVLDSSSSVFSSQRKYWPACDTLQHFRVVRLGRGAGM